MITSFSNARVREVIALKKKSKERASRDVFLVEGVKMFREAPSERLVDVYISESFYRVYRNSDVLQRAPLFEIVSDRVFDAMCDTQTPQGVICSVRMFHYTPDELLGSTGKQPHGQGSRPALVAALENLQDPGNLGTIVRTAEGAGATGILLSRGCVDIYNPKVIRSTMGSIYRVPFAYADDFTEVLCRWKAGGVNLCAACLQGSVPCDEVSYTGPSAFLIGNESRGLREETADLCGRKIRIPMCGKLESLNASVAASILMYEAFRQRRAAGRGAQ